MCKTYINNVKAMGDNIGFDASRARSFHEVETKLDQQTYEHWKQPPTPKVNI